MNDLVKILDNYSGFRNISRKIDILKKHTQPDKIVIMLCINGSARFNVRFSEYRMTRNSFLAIAPGLPFYCLEISEDCMIDIVVINERIFDKMAHGLIKFYFYRILYMNPLLEIPEDKVEICANIHAYLKSFVNGQEKNYFKKHITMKFLDIMFYEVCNIILQTPDNRASKDRHKDEITGKFIKLLVQDFRKNRKVEYYAAKLNITPKYLSAIVKAATGKPATAWIDDYTVLEAKTLLRTSASTIQEISYDLGFSTPSHFAKFFKDKTGVTPTEARNSQEFLY